MTAHTVPQAWKWRRLIAVVVTVVAAAASMATSSIEDEAWIGSPVASGHAILSPEQPEVLVPFTVELTEEAAAGRVSVDVSTPPIWLGVSDEVVAQGPDVSVETPSGVVRPQSQDYYYDTIVCDSRCRGSNLLVLRWPDGVESGSVAISWSIKAGVVFFDSEEPPEGAEVALVAEDSPQDSGLVWTWSVEVGSARPMVVGTVRIASSTPLADGDLSLHRPGRPPYAAAIQVLQSGEWEDLPVQNGMDIVPPAECADGPCTFELQLLASVPLAYPRGRATLEFVAPDRDGALTFTGIESDPWESTPAGDATALTLDPATAEVSVPISLEMPGDAPAGATPMFWVTYSLDLVEYESEDTVVTAVPYDPQSGHSGQSVVARSNYEYPVRAAVLPADCSGSRCVGEFEMRMQMRFYSKEDPDPAVVELTVEAVLLSPVPVADSGDLSVEIGSTQ